MVVVPSQMGRLNKRALLTQLQRLGTASRADLAKSLGLSQPTAGKIVDELLELGAFEEVAATNETPGESQGAAAKPGRPGRMLRLTRSRARFLGIQLGVTQTSLAPLPIGIGDTGEDSWPMQFRTPRTPGDWVWQLEKMAAQIEQKSFWGILVSAPGLVDEQKSEILYSPNLHWTEKARLPALVRQVWRAPVLLLQEERALALGHHANDPSDGDFLLVDFGEGVGGAVMLGGRLFAHPLPIGGELGHTPVPGNERVCGCGAIGCLETLVSTRGLVKSLAAASGNMARNWEALEKHVAQHGVVPWLARSLEATASVIAGALNVLGLRRVVVTGTLNELPPAVLSYLTDAVNRGTLWARFGEVKVEGAPRRRKAGLVAAGIDRFIVPVGDAELNSP